MNRTFDIFCNHCGSKVIVKPFEVKVVCQNCRTYLQIEETETTISTLVIDELTFLELNDSLVVKGRSSQNEIQFYKEELINLEGNWEIELETYKIKNGKKRILPRRNQSMVFLFIAIGMSLVGIYSGLFSKNNNWILLIIGPVWLYTSSREFHKFRTFKEAEEDYLNEKERLENEIQLLKNNM